MATSQWGNGDQSVRKWRPVSEKMAASQWGKTFHAVEMISRVINKCPWFQMIIFFYDIKLFLVFSIIINGFILFALFSQNKRCFLMILFSCSIFLLVFVQRVVFCFSERFSLLRCFGNLELQHDHEVTTFALNGVKLQLSRHFVDHELPYQTVFVARTVSVTVHANVWFIITQYLVPADWHRPPPPPPPPPTPPDPQTRTRANVSPIATGV